MFKEKNIHLIVIIAASPDPIFSFLLGYLLQFQVKHG